MTARSTPDGYTETIFRLFMFCTALLALLYMRPSWDSSNDLLGQKLVNGCRTHHMERPDFFHMPSSRQELINLLSGIGEERGMAKVIGGFHSWSNITSVTSRNMKGRRKTHLISLDKYNHVIDLNTENLTVRVQAGIRLWQLQQYLESHGFTMAQIGSIMEQSIAGVISTGTHGTGLSFGVISTLVEEIELMTIDSNAKVQVHEISETRNSTLFSAARVSLGALGVITEVRLRVERQHYLHHIQDPISIEEVFKIEEDIVRSNKFVKYWHLPHTGYGYNYISNPLPSNESLWTEHQRKLKKGYRALNDWIDQRFLKSYCLNFAFQLSPVRWIPFVASILHKTFVHVETVDTLSRCIVLRHDVPDHVEAEYIVPMEYWKEMLHLLIDLEERHLINFIIEMRFVRGDDILMSHAYGLDEAAYFTFGLAYSDDNRANRIFEDAQIAAEKLAAKHDFPLRLHWGKELILLRQGRLREHVMKNQPGFQKFARIREELDPLNVFVNDFHAHLFNVKLDRLIDR